LGVFADEKPPRGIGGFIDWRLNGMISRESNTEESAVVLMKKH